MWLKLSTTNNDPAVVVNHYLETIVKLQGRFSYFFNVCSCVTLYYLFYELGGPGLTLEAAISALRICCTP